jgi:hypothetical protein
LAVAFFTVVFPPAALFAVALLAVAFFTVVFPPVALFAVALFAVAFFTVVFPPVALFAVALFAVAFFTVVFPPVALFAGMVCPPSDVVLSCPVITSLKAPSGQEARRPCRGPIRQGNPQAERPPSTDRPNGALASQLARLPIRPIRRAEDRDGDLRSVPRARPPGCGRPSRRSTTTLNSNLVGIVARIRREHRGGRGSGDPSAEQRLVAGDAVKVTARLEQAAAPRADPPRGHDLPVGEGRGRGRTGVRARPEGQGRTLAWSPGDFS